MWCDWEVHVSEITEMVTLDSFFMGAAERWPDEIALDIPPDGENRHRVTFTYAEMRNKALELASVFQARGVMSNDIVGILLPRTNPFAFVAQIAVNLLGAAYVSIDPVFPEGHVERIIADAQPKAILTDTERGTVLLRLTLGSMSMINCDHFGPATVDLVLPAVRDPAALAYLIYTSGTTGLPKGVMITHKGICNLITSDLTYFDIGPTDRCAQGSSHSYDSSVEEIWMAWSTGAVVVVMDDSVARLGPDLIPWLQHERVTVLCPPPTLLRTTGCDDPHLALPDVRILYVGGEPLPQDIVDLWAPGRRLVNGYGPTECSVTALRTDVCVGDAIVVGRPVAGLSAYLLDETLTEVPSGMHGELCLGGPGLALGYRNRPDLTQEKFIEHADLGRLYRTGDLARERPDGMIDCLGRIDAQIKLRGYRIELEAIEAELLRCPGIREAACHVQGSSGREELAAWLVLNTSIEAIDLLEIRATLSIHLPFYMVPSRFGVLSTLPRTTGGKLKRDALPDNAPPLAGIKKRVTLPSSDLEQRLVTAIGTILGIPESDVSVDDDFFMDLGGTSLLAAKCVSLLRKDSLTASITVRAIYESRNVSAIARDLEPGDTPQIDAANVVQKAYKQYPLWVSMGQLLWIFLEAVIAAYAAARGAQDVVPWSLERFGLGATLLLAPLVGLIGTGIWTGISVVRAIILKWLLVGVYKQGDIPIWGWMGLRYWIVAHTIRQIPWGNLEGSVLCTVVLRGLGARIGKNVHFHRGSLPLEGGWDLLEVGDDVNIGQDACIQIIDRVSGGFVTRPVTLAHGVCVSVRGTVAGSVIMGEWSLLGPLSALSSGTVVPPFTRWDGVPAVQMATLNAASAPSEPTLSEAKTMVIKVTLTSLLGTLESFPFVACLCLAGLYLGLDESVLLAHLAGSDAPHTVFILGLASILAVPFTLLIEALMARWMGHIQPGCIPLRSLRYVRVWIATSLVASASRWLSGSLFWPIWLRIAGLKMGSNCEVSTLVDLVPRMVMIDSDTFCADGIYLGCPEIRGGTVTLGAVHIQRDSFFGNHAVIAPGSALPPDILVGICTVASPTEITQGSSWFGLPSFELPRREILDVDRSLTHSPDFARYMTRLFWESLRFAVPALPTILWAMWLGKVQGLNDIVGFFLAGITLPGTVMVLLLVLKWLLLGRVRPGVHPLWSCWCSRWDYLYVLWSAWALPALVVFEGTLWLNVYLRLMGMKIGHRVALSGGFSQVVDPDMITIEDDATVAAIFQAHTFEDRVLKIDRVHIGRGVTMGHGTVPLYGAVMGEGSVVTANSVVMKEEVLLADRIYSGAPCKATGRVTRV